MTFVAQPYEQFVDDLLTSLTGGISREEHRITGREEPYSLATPGAIPNSIRLFGQYNEAFILFEAGRDYAYNSEEGSILWLDEGRLPDENSFFYINYYVRSSRPHLSDRNPGSTTATASEAFARQYAVLHKQMEIIYRSAFVDFAPGASLDHVASLLGLSRRGSANAVGEVLFKRSTPAPGDITIPAGTIVSTSQGQNFESVEKRVLRNGQLSITAPIRSQVEGPPGQTTAGTIGNINRPLFGIETVINEADTFFATEQETDEAFRRRIKGAVERAGKSTLNAIKFALIEAVPEITEGNMQITERVDVPGMVEVKLGLEAPPEPELVRRVEDAIFQSRPAGVKVVHNLATRTLSPNEQTAESESQMESERTKTAAAILPPEVLAEMPEGVLKLKVNVTLQLIEPNISASEKESLEINVREQIMNYIDQLPMGDDIIYNKLLGRVMQIEEIADANLFIDAYSGSIPVRQENLKSDGRKATIQAEDIAVLMMEETVHIRIDIKVEPVPGQAQPASDALQRIDNTTREAVNRVLASSSGILTLEAIQAAIKEEIDRHSAFRLIAVNAVQLNAEYEETGRLLNNTPEVVLAENQIPRLQSLNVNLWEPLDG